MRTTYDPETDALYLRVAERPTVETEGVLPGTMLDLDGDGRIVAIEVLDASEPLAAASDAAAPTAAIPNRGA